MVWSSESDLEDWFLERLAGLGYETGSGADISPEARDPERRSFYDAIQRKTFVATVAELNLGFPEGAVAKHLAKTADEALVRKGFKE